MRKNGLITIVILLLFVTPILAQCGGGSDPEPTATPEPPTATAVPATVAPEPTEAPEEPEAEPTEEPAEEPEAEPTEEPAEEPADASPEATEEPAEEPADTSSEDTPAEDASAEDAEATDRSGEIDTRTGEAYPAPLADGAYPAPASQVKVEEYPEPVPCPSMVFNINEPLRDGDTEISGTGVEGVGILIVSITMMGEELGEIIIGEDGTWAIETEEPLSEDHGLGIRLVSTPPEFEDQEAFINSHIWPCGGDNLKDYPIPSIGLLLDSAQVQSADFE